MTIAIGMLHKTGVILSGDSLVTAGTMGSYQSKISGYRMWDADVMFALAGNVDLAESAIEQCEPVLREVDGKGLTARHIRERLRPILAREYKRHVISLSYVNSVYDYSLLLAIRANGGNAELHYTYSTTIRKSKSGLESIGAGSDLAQYLLRPSYSPVLPYQDISDMAAHAVGAIKRRMPGLVGGSNLMLSLENDGSIILFSHKDLSLIEKYAGFFRGEADGLLLQFLEASLSPDAFKIQLDTFSAMAQHIRGQLISERETIVWSSAPMEFHGAIIDFHPEARSYRQSTTDDQSNQPPSPESPGETDES